jgi:A/G-specific adenine glycosylase
LSCRSATPSTYDGLLRIDGIGAYTAGAVASIAFGQCVPAVDGNVLRVLARLFGVRNGDVKEKEFVAQAGAVARALAEGCADAKIAPGDWNQALMEVGATVCTPGGEPQCAACPFAAECRAHALRHSGKISAIAGEIPTASKKAPPRIQRIASLVIRHAVNDDNVCQVKAEGGDALKSDEYYLVQRPLDGGLLAGLWEFPSVPMPQHPPTPAAAGAPVAVPRGLREWVCAGGGKSAPAIAYAGPVRHVFSHITMTIEVFVVTVPARTAVTPRPPPPQPPPARWVAAGDVLARGHGAVAVSTQMAKVLRHALQPPKRPRSSTPRAKVAVAKTDEKNI